MRRFLCFVDMQEPERLLLSELKPVETVKKGEHFSMKLDKIRPSDKLYKLVSTEELKKFKGLE